MSSSRYRTMATVTASGISGMLNSTATGVPDTSPQGTVATIITITARTSHNSCRRMASVPRRYRTTSATRASTLAPRVRTSPKTQSGSSWS